MAALLCLVLQSQHDVLQLNVFWISDVPNLPVPMLLIVLEKCLPRRSHHGSSRCRGLGPLPGCSRQHVRPAHHLQWWTVL